MTAGVRQLQLSEQNCLFLGQDILLRIGVGSSGGWGGDRRETASFPLGTGSQAAAGSVLSQALLREAEWACAGS